MKKRIIAVCISVLSLALPAFAQSEPSTKKGDAAEAKVFAKRTKQEVYASWEKLRKDEAAEAYKTAKEYVASFPDDKSSDAEALRKWLQEYEKTVKANSAPKDDLKTGAGGKAESAGGVWIIVVTTQQGDMHFKLMLKQEGTKITGAVESIYGKGSVSSGKLEGNLINLELEADPLEVKLKGTIDNNKMKGQVTSNIPNIPELPFVGTRSP